MSLPDDGRPGCSRGCLGQRRRSVCGWPPDQPARFTEQLKRGGIASVLMGHANAEAFFSMGFDAGQSGIGRPIAADRRSAKVRRRRRCSSSRASPDNFGQPDALRGRGVPADAGRAGGRRRRHDRIASPAQLLLRRLSLEGDRPAQKRGSGALWLNAQREAKQSHNVLIESVLRDVEGKLDPRINVAKLRRDQMLMYAIFGDPATRLIRLPERLEASIERPATGWRWRAEKPIGVRTRTSKSDFGRRSRRLPAWEGGSRRRAGRRPRRSTAANAGFAFMPLPSPADDGAWQGDVERGGWIRLVASDKIIFTSRF